MTPMYVREDYHAAVVLGLQSQLEMAHQRLAGHRETIVNREQQLTDAKLEIERLRETKDWSLLTQLRDENRSLRERVNNQATIIQAAQVHTDRLTKVLGIDEVDARVYETRIQY